jgi:hypothetical protein
MLVIKPDQYLKKRNNNKISDRLGMDFLLAACGFFNLSESIIKLITNYLQLMSIWILL